MMLRSRPPAIQVAKKNTEEYDAQDLYLASVQCPEADVAFFEKVFKKHADRPMRYLREDFCGTAALCAEWVKQHPENRAIGVDYHEPTLDWGRQRILPLLSEDERNRIELVCDDVRHIADTQADLLCAQNFSYWIFSEREEMKRYLEIAKESIVEDGLLVLDLLGGTESTSVDTEERKVDDGTKVDGSKLPTFTYIWDQHSYNPITGDMQCYIHFKVKRKMIKKAFSYRWRMWTLPELRDILFEIGFKDVTVYTEGWDDDSDESDGVFRKRKDFDHEGSFIAYIVAKKK